MIYNSYFGIGKILYWNKLKEINLNNISFFFRKLKIFLILLIFFIFYEKMRKKICFYIFFHLYNLNYNKKNIKK